VQDLHLRTRRVALRCRAGDLCHVLDAVPVAAAGECLLGRPTHCTKAWLPQVWGNAVTCVARKELVTALARRRAPLNRRLTHGARSPAEIVRRVGVAHWLLADAGQVDDCQPSEREFRDHIAGRAALGALSVRPAMTERVQHTVA
jgi:hypothetical protein